MSDSSGRLADALRRAQPITDGKLYTMISLNPEALPHVAQVLTEDEAFQAVLVDSREVTLILPETRWKMLAGMLRRTIWWALWQRSAVSWPSSASA